MSDGDNRLVSRDPDTEKRHDAAMREGSIERRYRAAYLGVGLFVIIALLWALHFAGVF